MRRRQGKEEEVGREVEWRRRGAGHLLEVLHLVVVRPELLQVGHVLQA